MEISKAEDIDVKFEVLKKDVHGMIKAVMDSLIKSDSMYIKFIGNDVKVIKMEDGNILNTPYVGPTLEINVKRGF